MHMIIFKLQSRLNWRVHLRVHKEDTDLRAVTNEFVSEIARRYLKFLFHLGLYIRAITHSKHTVENIILGQFIFSPQSFMFYVVFFSSSMG